MKLSIEKQRLAFVAILLVWCTALCSYRIYLASDSLAVGLLWNLFLAAVPLVWSAAFQTTIERKRPFLAGVFFLLWLLFLPNAPYILTDLIHLASYQRSHLWSALTMILSCAGAGLALGYLSLISVHNVIKQKFGEAIGWAVVIGSLMLCSFGIYLGRFLRWNSWDALTNPIQLAKAVAGQFINSSPHPHPLSVTLITGIGLTIGYMALRIAAASLSSE